MKVLDFLITLLLSLNAVEETLDKSINVMTLKPQEQETVVEEGGKELFRDHTRQLFFAVSFLGIF